MPADAEGQDPPEGGEVVPREAPEPEPAAKPNVPVAEIVESLEKLPPSEAKDRLQAIFASMYSWSGPAPHPLADKIDSEHIKQMIEAEREESRGEFSDRKHARIAGLVASAVVGGILLALVFGLAQDNPELAETITTLLLGSGLGFTGGYGWRGRAR